MAVNGGKSGYAPEPLLVSADGSPERLLAVLEGCCEVSADLERAAIEVGHCGDGELSTAALAPWDVAVRVGVAIGSRVTGRVDAPPAAVVVGRGIGPVRINAIIDC
jgi:hypothetical protein